MVLQRWAEWGVELDVWCCKDGQNGVLSWMCGVAKMDRMRCRVGCVVLQRQTE